MLRAPPAVRRQPGQQREAWTEEGLGGAGERAARSASRGAGDRIPGAVHRCRPPSPWQRRGRANRDGGREPAPTSWRRQVTPATPSPRRRRIPLDGRAADPLPPVLLCPAARERLPLRRERERGPGLATGWRERLGKPAPQASCSNRLRLLPAAAAAALSPAPRGTGFPRVLREAADLVKRRCVTGVLDGPPCPARPNIDPLKTQQLRLCVRLYLVKLPFLWPQDLNVRNFM